jgi:mannan endo-1,4-beta-mannosidase
MALLQPRRSAGLLIFRGVLRGGAGKHRSAGSALSALPRRFNAVRKQPASANRSGSTVSMFADAGTRPMKPRKPKPRSSPTPAPTPAPGASATYRVSGRSLLDPCGEKVVVRGVEQMFWGASWLYPWFVTEIGRTGANAVRILPQISSPTPDGLPPLALATMEQLIQLGVQSRMLVDVAVDGGKNPDIYLRSDVKSILLRYEKNIAIHAVGEAYESTGLAWATRVKGVISRLRAAGYKAPLYVMSIDGGRNLPAILSYGAEILASDPVRNVVFGWQAYWGSSNYYQNRYGMTLAQAMARVRDSALPIQVGLLKTTDPGETMNYSTVMADAQAYGVGWLWWDWRMSTDDLTTDGVYGHWAPGGEAVAVTDPNSIANTSVRTYFQRNNTCPTT